MDMINIEKFNKILTQFKIDFPGQHWNNEKYKWEAVKHFQKNWDINAPDFREMFMQATAKSSNLLASMHNYPRGMIDEFSSVDSERTRAMFMDLFDESKDLASRIVKFQSDAESMRQAHDDGTWKQHYQGDNALSTYLWLRFPDQYYIYKYSVCRDTAKELNADFAPKKGKSVNNVLACKKLYDEICELLKGDTELKEIVSSCLKDDCYSDPECRTLTIDFGYYISRYYKKESEPAVTNDWWPSLDEYDPGITTAQWIALLSDEDIFFKSSLEIVARIKDYGGQATCKQLSLKYGETSPFYISGSASLAKRIVKKTNCPKLEENNENARWWPILYVGKYADKDTAENYIWKLRPELAEALDQIDLSGVELFASVTNAKPPQGADMQYWFLNANPKIWSFSNIAVEAVQSYTLYNDNGNKRRIFQNFLDAKEGDMIIGYESTPVKKIVAIGRVSAEQDGEKIYFEKLENLASPIDYATLKASSELKDMEYFSMQQGSLFKLTKDEYNFIMDLIREENPIVANTAYEPYDKAKFLSQVYMTEDRYDTLVHLLKNKKNIILQGAPGVGKTYAAKRLAYSMMGEIDESRVEFVQFHQNYSYEDFIMGYKPNGDGFELKYGIFYRFCQKAASQPGKDYFFIIDEINRGNMSKILGELMMLIEKDYRGTKATLAYDGLPFSVPENLYIIGMMNTADRSLAMIDYALRRRFSFFSMEPGFNTKGFKAYQNAFHNETFDLLIDQIVELNKEITADASLGAGFCIGHSYFCGQDECTDEWMNEVVEYDILPMLAEYWFDDKAKRQRWENNLHGVIND